MPLRNTIQTILTDYHAATAEPLEGHKIATFIRHSAAKEVEEALGELGAGLIVEGSLVPMFKRGFSPYDVSMVLARAAGECCPNDLTLLELHNVLHRACTGKPFHQLVDEAKERLAAEGGEQ